MSRHRKGLKIINLLLLLFPIIFLLHCTQPPADDTARSGQMSIAVDRQFEGIIGSEVTMFHSYYPDAYISLMAVSPNKSLKLLLNHKVRAALIGGEPEVAEDSLVVAMKSTLRREPIARDAMICIVNVANPAKQISLVDIKDLFIGKGKSGLIPLVTADDLRLHSLLAAKTGGKRSDLSAWACSSDEELMSRVSADKKAVGLLFRSSFHKVSQNKKGHYSIKILPVAKEESNVSASLPTQQNIFDGSYPLVTTVYYVYYPGDALAAGFGAWLGSEGQKAFERSDLAPFKLVERTITLK
ncbi:MAG: phosphate-binding protein [Chlorobium sp.]|nr:MAG: phosphate-binding protein [Chlorobium sp.]